MWAMGVVGSSDLAQGSKCFEIPHSFRLWLVFWPGRIQPLLLQYRNIATMMNCWISSRHVEPFLGLVSSVVTQPVGVCIMMRSQGGRWEGGSGGGRLRPTDTVVISPATHHPRGRNSFWVCNIENLSSSSWSSSSSSSKSSSSSNLSPCIKDGENVKPQQKERNSIGEPVCVDCNSHSLLSLLANSFYPAIIIWRGGKEKTL